MPSHAQSQQCLGSDAAPSHALPQGSGPGPGVLPAGRHCPLCSVVSMRHEALLPHPRLLSLSISIPQNLTTSGDSQVSPISPSTPVPQLPPQGNGTRLLSFGLYCPPVLCTGLWAFALALSFTSASCVDEELLFSKIHPSFCVHSVKFQGLPLPVSPHMPGRENICAPGVNGCLPAGTPGGFVLRSQPDLRSGGGPPGAPLGAFTPTAVHQLSSPPLGLNQQACFFFPGCVSRTGCRSPMSPIISPAQRSCKYGAERIGGPLGYSE